MEDRLDHRGHTLGLVAIWPPQQKLKLGIDLSGGTILVYEAENLAARLQHGRVDRGAQEARRPEGVKEIPIRKIGSNRIEIILPQASNEEVEEVKKMLTDVGSLEFRILANRKHDAEAILERTRPRWAGQAAVALQVGPAGRDLDGNQPHFHQRHLTDVQQNGRKICMPVPRSR